MTRTTALSALLLLCAVGIALATDMPPEGDYTIHSGGEQTGTCQFQGDPDATRILWDNNDQEDIFLLDPPNCRYVSSTSDTQLVFEDNGDGSYDFTQSPALSAGDRPEMFKKVRPVVKRGRVLPFGGMGRPVVIAP